MIIGVDGGALSQQDKRLQVGVYKVNHRLLENLSHLDYSNNYRIYTFNSRGEGSHFKYGSKFESRVVKPAFGWQKIWLPLELWRNQPDLFLGLSQSVPWITRDLKYKINLNVAQYSPISKTNSFKNNQNIYQTHNSLIHT
jgi:hypothetical protein